MVAPNLPPLILREGLTAVPGGMGVVIQEVEGKAGGTALHCGAWRLGPAGPRSPCGPWQRLTGL